MSSAKNDSVQLGVASQGNTCSYLRLRPFAQRLFHIDLHYIYVASKCSSILTTTSPVSTSCNNNLSCQGPLPFDESFAKLNSVRPRKSDKEVKKKYSEIVIGVKRTNKRKQRLQNRNRSWFVTLPFGENRSRSKTVMQSTSCSRLFTVKVICEEKLKRTHYYWVTEWTP